VSGNPQFFFISLDERFLIVLLSMITANLCESVDVNVGSISPGSNILLIGKLNLLYKYYNLQTILLYI